MSAIVIFLDERDFLPEAVASIRAQTSPHWELLLVDDGSTDGSSEIARDLAAGDPARIRHLEHPGHENRGMSASRNLGIRHARGEFVAFLDADDVWVPTKLAEQVELLRRHPRAAMVYGRTLIWHSWSDHADAPDHFYDLGVAADQLVEPPELAHLLLENRAQTPTTCNAMLRRDVVVAVGGCEDAFRGMYEDQVLFFKIVLDHPVVVADRCWAKYRQHPGNRSGPATDRGARDAARRTMVRWLLAYAGPSGRTGGTAFVRAIHREERRLRHPGVLRVRRAARRLIGRVRRRRAASP